MITVILTGGKSRRMGWDKALLELDGCPVPLLLAKRYEEALGKVAFSVDKKGRFPCGNYLEFEDAFPGKGPFNGLYSAFMNSNERIVFLTATDMPNGDPGLVLHMLHLMQEHDVCAIRRSNGFLEPLFALYRDTCLNLVLDCLKSNKLSLLEIFESMDVLEVPEETLTKWDLNKILYNINTPDDFKEFQSIWRESNAHSNPSR